MTALVDKYRPRRVEDFAGITGPKSVLRKLAECPYPSAWCFTGPPGTGKTAMSFALAENIGGQIYHLSSRACDLESVKRIREQCSYVPFFGTWNFVICSEADQMTGAAQLAFLSILDGTETPPNTIFLFSCNDTAKLEKRFLGRTRVLRFGMEREASSAIEYLETIWRAEAGDVPPPNFRDLLRESDYSMRECLMKMEVELMAPTGSTHLVQKDAIEDLGEKVSDLLRSIASQPGAAEFMAPIGDKAWAALDAFHALKSNVGLEVASA